VGPAAARQAERSRAADLAIVASDPDLRANQTLQGWLMHDAFAMHGGFGAPYEFLWANPYQPGLSYYYLPLAYYNADFGKLFVRSSWEDSATWLGIWDGVIQKDEGGQPTPLSPEATPQRFAAAVVAFGASKEGFGVSLEEGQRLFVAGLAPKHAYQVEIEGRQPFEAPADPGGIVELKPPPGKYVSIRLQ
ncbi:MAG TPA: hypothetical protein VMU19_08680, partial [Bryobacteraceae bacterium]|nr:hypothetical protein [Bryobacteraceae bacterium]